VLELYNQIKVVTLTEKYNIQCTKDLVQYFSSFENCKEVRNAMYISCKKYYLILLRQLEPAGKKELQECFSLGSRKRLALCCGCSSSKSLIPVPILVFPKSGICGLGIPVPVPVSVFATSIQNGFFFPTRQDTCRAELASSRL
jgi:hypothetical protein